ncbi:hypothetical protein IL59_0208475 [Brucella suis bv. 4 str. 40]|nr:hypothetical protein IL59_0208475 [Brucella suis bv. 4 str. 40]
MMTERLDETVKFVGDAYCSDFHADIIWDAYRARTLWTLKRIKMKIAFLKLEQRALFLFKAGNTKILGAFSACHSCSRNIGTRVRRNFFQNVVFSVRFKLLDANAFFVQRQLLLLERYESIDKFQLHLLELQNLIHRFQKSVLDRNDVSLGERLRLLEYFLGCFQRLENSISGSPTIFNDLNQAGNIHIPPLFPKSEVTFRKVPK